MIDVAFRAHADERWAPVREEDVMRVLDERVLALANAYGDEWGAFFPAGARLALDLFAEHWSRTGDLEASFANVRLEFPSRSPSLPGGDTGDGQPLANLLVACIDGDCAAVVWIGPQHLAVVREGVVVARTQPDTLVELGRAQGFDMTDSAHRHMLTRTIRREDILPPHTARFALEKGDRVIVASEAVDHAIAGSAREVLDKLPRDKFECVIVVS